MNEFIKKKKTATTTLLIKKKCTLQRLNRELIYIKKNNQLPKKTNSKIGEILNIVSKRKKIPIEIEINIDKK